MKSILGSGVIAMTVVMASGCVASSDPTSDDEQGVDIGDSMEETVGTAEQALTSMSYSTYMGGAGSDKAAGTAVDSAGNVYVVGTTSSYGTGGDVYIAKRNAAGSLIYYTYFGGSGAQTGNGIAVDSSGNAYVIGTTTAYSASGDIFMAKLNAAGSALLYFTSFGGSASETAGGIAIDSGGQAYAVGTTSSTDFPVTAGAFQTSRHGWNNAFVTKLNAAGNALVYSTYLGSNAWDYGNAIAVDGQGYAYVTGRTEPVQGITSFPTTIGAFQTKAGANGDVFVTKLNVSGTALVYSTYLGGNETDSGSGIAVDGSFNVYVTGYTYSNNFPTTQGSLRTVGTGCNAFVTKLTVLGNSVAYSTYLGGNGLDASGIYSDSDAGNAIAVNNAGSAYVTGATTAVTFPTTPGAFRTSPGGGLDGFVVQLNPGGSALSYSSYLGGSLDDFGYGIAVDSSGKAYVAGTTKSANFPVLSASQPASGGGEDAFVLKINGP